MKRTRPRPVSSQTRTQFSKSVVRIVALSCDFLMRYFSVEEAERHLRREQWHAGDEGREPADDEGEEGDHPGAVPLAPLPPAPHDCCHPAALSAAVWHQRCECPGLGSDHLRHRENHSRVTSEIEEVIQRSLWVLYCLGFLLLHSHLWESRRWAACLRHHWSRCRQHSLHCGVGEFYILVWMST